MKTAFSIRKLYNSLEKLILKYYFLVQKEEIVQ